MAWESPIIRVSTGLLNTVNDTVIANQAGISGVSKFGGQLGKALWVDSMQIGQMFDPTVGTLYGGGYRYVKLDDVSPAPEIGQWLFWTGDPEDWTVSTLYGLTDLWMPAGLYIGGIEPNDYGFIQFAGVGTVLYATPLSVAAATGVPVIVTSSGLTQTSDASANPSLLVGQAISLPVADGLGTININNMLALRN